MYQVSSSCKNAVRAQRKPLLCASLALSFVASFVGPVFAAPLQLSLPLAAVHGESLEEGANSSEVPGADLDRLLRLARAQNPEYAAMLLDADAAAERIDPAGNLPDPKLRVELRDLTRMGEQRASFDPTRVGSTRYLLMQDLPWYGKLGLKKDIATLEAAGAQSVAQSSWIELVARIKSLYVQRYFVYQNTRLTQEILELMNRLERVAQSRYAGGLAAQQDVIRAQIEQTDMRNELLALDGEKRQLAARMNALIARPANASLAEVGALPPLPAAAKLDHVSLEARLRARNPQLFADDARLQAAEKNRDLVLRNRYPDLTVGVSPIQYGKALREWELMVEMNIPLQQGTRRAQERESERMLAAARSRKEATANRLVGELAEILANVDTAMRSEKLASNSLLPQADLTLQSAIAVYENGKIDFATLLDAQRQIRQARLTQYKAQAQAQLGIAELEKLLGEEL